MWVFEEGVLHQGQVFIFFMFSRETICYLPKNMANTETSAGEMPLILLAWPNVSGLYLFSFSRASKESEFKAW